MAQRLTAMNSDEWQAHVTREAAKAMGEWLEGRGRLHQPIAALSLADLEAMAANAISTVGKGESDPLVKTGDGVREAQNRRAEIVYQQ